MGVLTATHRKKQLYNPQVSSYMSSLSPWSTSEEEQ